jgi:hypothetical protein
VPQTDTSKPQVNITFPGLLTVLFIGLKLANIIDWPWVWVLSPIWIPLALLLVFGLIATIIALVLDMTTGYKKPKR